MVLEQTQNWLGRAGFSKGIWSALRNCSSAHRIANPQWTPLEAEAPEWMKLGFKLYEALEGLATVHEVFPTASYTLLQGNADVRIDADFSAYKPGPKDMLDAWVAAATVREFEEGSTVLCRSLLLMKFCGDRNENILELPLNFFQIEFQFVFKNIDILNFTCRKFQIWAYGFCYDHATDFFPVC